MIVNFPKLSYTASCSLIYKEVVSNYLQQCLKQCLSYLLDASKAFDRIHSGKYLLFYTSYIGSVYTEAVCVSWNNYIYIYIYLFINKLLIQLKESGYGCHLNGIYMGALAYADDITITFPSRRGVHEMLLV